MPQTAELILIRHAPIADGTRLCGRTDLPARVDPAAIAALRPTLPQIAALATSPAQRCRQTAQALWPERPVPDADPRLWEQDFGAHDGLPYAALPDLGTLSGDALAAWAPPGGESFADLCTRIAPALAEYAARAAALAGPVALVVHAGVIRAAMAALLGSPARGLVFEIAPLSVTRLRCDAQGLVSAIAVNRI